MGSGLTLASANNYGASTSLDQDHAAGALGLSGVVSSIVGGALTGFGMTGNVLGAAAGSLLAIVSQAPAFLSSISMLGSSITR